MDCKNNENKNDVSKTYTTENSTANGNSANTTDILQHNNVQTTSYSQSISSSANKKSKAKIIIPIVVIAIAIIGIIAGICGYNYYNNVYVPEQQRQEEERQIKSQYNQALNIFYGLKSQKNSYANNFTVDEDTLKKFTEAKNLFKDLGDYQQSKLFYYDFEMAENIYRTNVQWDSADTQQYLAKAADIVETCFNNGLITEELCAKPTNDSQQLFCFLDGALWSALGYKAKSDDSIECFTRSVNFFTALESSNNNKEYWFCSHSSQKYINPAKLAVVLSGKGGSIR